MKRKVSDYMFCPECGKPVEDTDNVCGFCGEPLHKQSGAGIRLEKSKQELQYVGNDYNYNIELNTADLLENFLRKAGTIFGVCYVLLTILSSFMFMTQFDDITSPGSRRYIIGTILNILTFCIMGLVIIFSLKKVNSKNKIILAIPQLLLVLVNI